MNEADLEELAMAWFDKLGYQTAYGPDIEPGGSAQEPKLWKAFNYVPICL